MHRRVQLGKRVIGAGEPVYVIAEIGANHNRDFDVAKRLIDTAAAAGADAVKFQTYSGDRIYSKRTPKISSLQAFSEKPAHEVMEAISLPRDWQGMLAEHAQSRGIDFFSAPFDHQAVDELHEIGVPLLKIASFEIGDIPLVRHAAATGRPLIISTGMATLGEIEEALEAVRTEGGEQVVLLQCTSMYPAPARLINLRAMATMEQAFAVPVGLSDHTTGVAVPIAAAALGAAMIEKHYTLDRTMPGPDHSFSLEPDELKELVSGVREARQALGDGVKAGPSPEERDDLYRVARRSLVATRDLPRGTVLERHMLTTKRPGLGIAPRELDRVVGRELKVALSEDDILQWEMI
ncbi:MAG: N-acetylneuraminate synthase family protein [Solirubrobacteraceae bacterium]